MEPTDFGGGCVNILVDKPSAKQLKEIKELEEIPLASGECRSIYICQDDKCRQIQAHDFIPYGIGAGVWRNPCMCHAVDRNWIFSAKLIKEIPVEELAEAWKTYPQ